MISVTYHCYIRRKLRIGGIYFVLSFHCHNDNVFCFVVLSHKLIHDNAVDYLGKVGIQNVCADLPPFEVYLYQITHFH